MKLTHKRRLKENTYYFIYYVSFAGSKEFAFLHIKDKIFTTESFNARIFMRSASHPDEDLTWNIGSKVDSLLYYELSEEELEDILIKTI